MVYLARLGGFLNPIRCVTVPSVRMRRCGRSIHTSNEFLNISEEVQNAVREKKPVVALETTIYTHGFPYPNNLELAMSLEDLVRANGAVPATCGIINGVAKVGMSEVDLKMLVQDRTARKVSRRDFGFVTGSGLINGQRLNGGTTISGTMVLAHLAGIKVFATGGLGGVHRGGESSMDISADLTEFARTPVAVISSGCKGFLDIPRTLEFLETQGAAVATFADGRSGQVDFPAFWSRASGVKSPMVVKDEAEAAAMIYAQNTLPLSSGQFFANPVPAEHEIPLEEMHVIIKQALDAADKAGVMGSANTPFVLEEIRKLSNGRSVPANVALIEGNVIRGTKVAVELSKLETSGTTPSKLFAGDHWDPRSFNQPGEPNITSESTVKTSLQQPADILVAGSVALDLSCDYNPIPGLSNDIIPKPQTSNPAIITQTLGGVGSNIARAAHLTGASVRLCSVVTDDIAGKAILNQVRACGLDPGSIRVEPASSSTTLKTAQYVSVNDWKKNLVLAMADMHIMESAKSHFTSDVIANYISSAGSDWVILDTNWDAQTLKNWIQQAKAAGSSVALEPVSTAKSTRLFINGPTPLNYLTVFPEAKIDLATPNILELKAMHTAASDSNLFDRQDWWRVIDFMGISPAGARAELVQATSAALVDAGIPQMCIQLLPFIPCLLAKLGPDGVLMTQLLGARDPRLRSPEAAPYILTRASAEEAEALDIGGVYLRHFKAVDILTEQDLVSVNGAGDTFMGFIVAQLAKGSGWNIEEAVNLAQQASILTLKSREAVSPEIAKLARFQMVKR